jgi:hypothetical protein
MKFKKLEAALDIALDDGEGLGCFKNLSEQGAAIDC